VAQARQTVNVNGDCAIEEVLRKVEVFELGTVVESSRKLAKNVVV
jgi:hypothetical protein